MAVNRILTFIPWVNCRHKFNFSNQISYNCRLSNMFYSSRKLPEKAPLANKNYLGLKYNTDEFQKRLPNYFEMCPAIKQEEVQILHEMLRQILDDLENVPFVKNAVLANQRMREFARYTLLAAMPSHGTIVLEADRFYAEKRKANNELLENEKQHFRLVSVLFWAMNMYVQTLNIQDDIIDGNETRNNVKCWHMLDGIGLHAIRDSQLLKDAIFIILNKYFKNQEYYISLVDLMNECMYGTYIGFSEMEIIRPSTNVLKPKSLELLKPGKRYAYGFFLYGYIVSAMMMNGVNYQDFSNILHDVSMSTALIAAITEDYIDCYGDAKVNERNTTDIQEGKQTWLYWTALELGNPDQAQQLLNSYGKKETSSVETIKSIYANLRIQETVLQTLNGLDKNLEAHILELKHTDIPWVVFLNILKHYRGVKEGRFARP